MKTYTYIVRSGGGGTIKIGKTKNLMRRMGQLRRGSDCMFSKDAYSAPDYGPRLLFAFPGDYEDFLHRYWRTYRDVGEWFRHEGHLNNWIWYVTDDLNDDVILSATDREHILRGLPGPDDGYSPEFGENNEEAAFAMMEVDDLEAALEHARAAYFAAVDELTTAQRNVAALRV